MTKKDIEDYEEESTKISDEEAAVVCTVFIIFIVLLIAIGAYYLFR